MLSRITTRTLWRRILPQTETVTLRSRVAPAPPDADVETFTDYRINHAQQKPTRIGEEALAELTAAGLEQKRWMMWQDALDYAGAPAPKLGDVVVEGALLSWVVVGPVKKRLFGNEHDCECRRLPG